jgi:O-phosphoseryl-tRNA(Cys) synthetase
MKKTTTSRNSTRPKTGKKIKQEFPRGWNERKVRAVIRHYDRLTDDELAHEIETAREVSEETLISVPTELLPAVRRLIVRHQQSA